MVNHPNIGELISEKDREILKHLKDITVNLHEDYGFGFDINFTFDSPNPYFIEENLQKKFVMSRANVIEKVEATKINWKDGCNPTLKKVRKKRGGKKMMVNVACPSFFSFFDQIHMPSDDDLKQGKLVIIREDVEKDEGALDTAEDSSI